MKWLDIHGRNASTYNSMAHIRDDRHLFVANALMAQRMRSLAPARVIPDNRCHFDFLESSKCVCTIMLCLSYYNIFSFNAC